MAQTLSSLQEELADQRRTNESIRATSVTAINRLTNENELLRAQVQSAASAPAVSRRPIDLEGIRTRLDMDGVVVTPASEQNQTHTTGIPEASRINPVMTNNVSFTGSEGTRVNNPQVTATPNIQTLIQHAINEHMRSFDERLEKIPGVPQPIEKEAMDDFKESPFVDDIARVEIPKKFHLPSMTSYDGTSDPDDHISLYMQKLMTIFLSRTNHEEVMCKSFSTSLAGPTLTWFMHLPQGSIASFAELVNAFKVQFDSS